MRLTGSFHTTVTQGVARTVMSSLSGVVVGSTSTGLAVDTTPWCHGDIPLRRTGDLDGTAHRPLRADDGPGGAGQRHRPPAVGVRAVPAAAAGGPPLRRGGRRRTDAGRDRGVPVRRRGAGRS